MEPATSPPAADIAKPLSDFQKIGHNTYLWTSPLYLSQPGDQTPLILLFAWNAAAAKHIAKYTLTYKEFFPTSRILLVRCFTQDMFRSASSYSSLLQPAIELVAEHTTAGGEVLVHSFSNGGGNQVNEFAKAWKKKYGTVLPMRAQILDSSPTKGPWMKSHAAISASLPKSFEEADEHADIAKAKGWDVTKVQFEKSPHCGHIREDQRKYWTAVVVAWTKGPRDK
ncbi:unnamed protein product [Alternaria alternata]